MKKPILFAIGISMLSCATIFAATAVKLLTLGTAVYDDTIHVFGVPVTAIQNDADGFSVEMLPGLYALSLFLGLAAFIVGTLANRHGAAGTSQP